MRKQLTNDKRLYYAGIQSYNKEHFRKKYNNFNMVHFRDREILYMFWINA